MRSVRGREDRVRQFLREYVSADEEERALEIAGRRLEEAKNERSRRIRGIIIESMKTGYFQAFIDLDGDGQHEVVIELTGRRCGSGGCTLLVLAPEGPSYRLVSQTTITNPPIRVLNTTMNGWRDLSVVVSGGGVNPGFEASLRFDGESYPGSPFLAEPMTEEIAGEVILVPRFAAESKPVFDP